MYRFPVDRGRRRPSTLISSTDGSAFDPSSVTVLPLTVTRPCVISVSAVRREATPAAERIFCRRIIVVYALRAEFQFGVTVAERRN